MTSMRSLITLVESASSDITGLREAAEPSATILVDGIERPRLNSQGQPIHKTDAGITAFWRWFGNSKVVDEQGRPRVVYHGTGKRFAAFSKRKSISGIIWFTTERSDIEAGEVGAAGQGIILELYAKIDHPADWKQYDDLLLAQFESRGLDGAILMDTTGFTGFVFEPHQLKSATKNRGTFDATQAKLTETSADGSAGYDADEEERKGLAAIEHVMNAQVDAIDAMRRPELGAVSFMWGTEGRYSETKRKYIGGYGVAHIITQRDAEGDDGRGVARTMPRVIAHGVLGPASGPTGARRMVVQYEGYSAVLSEGADGHWLLTGFRDYETPR